MEQARSSQASPLERTLLPPVRWYNTLVFRVVLLCVVLVMCLLGAVYVISQHYVHAAVTEMEAQTRQIAESVEVLLQANPEQEVEDLEEQFPDTDITFSELGERAVPANIGVEPRGDGKFDLVARMTISHGDRRILQTMRVALNPQTDLIRAFQNKSMAAITVVFCLTLALMVYFIRRTLRPLGELSDSCSRISQGELTNVTVRRNAGEVLALEQTFNNMVTALKEKEVMEAKLRQAQRLSALGNLAAGVAHDVRNPLNSIKLLSSHAMDSAQDTPAARQLETIRKEVDRLDEIVAGFLSLAKEQELQPEPCKVDALLEESIRLVKQEAERQGIRLLTELRAGEAELMLDPKMFTRAVLNVLLNAMEACPPEGRVRLFSRTTDMACEIEIRDDGPGIPREVMEQVFDPYFTTKTTGTGLGLSITRGIIEEHGGSISLTSSEGQGCQALITLPFGTE